MSCKSCDALARDPEFRAHTPRDFRVLLTSAYVSGMLCCVFRSLFGFQALNRQRRCQPAGARGHRAARVFPCGEGLVTGISYTRGSPAVIWSARSGRALLEFRQPSDRIRFLELSPCGRRLATGGYRGIFLWDTGTGILVRELPIGRRGVGGGPSPRVRDVWGIGRT